MDNLRIGICDDDQQAIPLIETQIREVMKNYSNEVSITLMTFNDGEDFMKACKKTSFDLIFLDIEMPKHNGFQLAKDIRPSCLDTYFVFVSSHENCVYESFGFNARGFIRKSSMEKDIRNTIDKYMEDTAIRRISFKVDDGFGKGEVFVKDIYYIECNAHNLRIKTIEKEYHVYGSLKQMEEQLSNCDFVKTHRNYLVNKMYIKSVGSKTVELKDGSKVDMSRGQKQKVLEEMKQYDRRK